MTNEDFVTLAIIAKTQGRHGEVICNILTDFPEKFEERKRLFLWRPEKKGERCEIKLEDHWFHKGRVVLKFAGIDSINDAEPLVGCEVQIPESERAPLEEGRYYISDLKGCTLFNGDQAVGTVTDVNTDMAGAAPLIVVKTAKGEVDVPFAEAFIVSVDVAAKELRMNLPAGLLDVNQ
jgi:16S rRNA processing protein RimM